MHIGSHEEVKKMVRDWFNGMAADFYNASIQKLITQYECLNFYGDYSRNDLRSDSNTAKQFFNFIQLFY
jgi:hypothetical protein